MSTWGKIRIEVEGDAKDERYCAVLGTEILAEIDTRDHPDTDHDDRLKVIKAKVQARCDGMAAEEADEARS